MQRKIVVQKFGGSSLADEQGRFAAAQRVIATRHEGFCPVVVVSALGRYGAPYATDTLIQFANAIGPNIAARDLDLLLACGEIIATVVMAHTVRHLSGMNTIAVTGGQAGITTDWNFGSSRITAIHPEYLLHCIDRERIPVVAGFQGVTENDEHGVHGAVTTLGRGGSDTTAVALGVALGAEAVEIYTDVDGVLSADPDIVPNARRLDRITFEEICEMAYLGAKVMHSRAAEIAMQYELATWVKATRGTGTGTLIDGHIDGTERRITTGVTHSGSVSHVTLHIADEGDKPYVEHEIYRLLATADMPVYLVSTAPTSISFVIDQAYFERLRAVLNALVVPVHRPGEQGVRVYVIRIGGGSPTFEVQRRMIEAAPGMHAVTIPASIRQQARIVSLIGPGLQDTPGVMARLCECLDRSGIEVLQTGDSRLSLSVLVSDVHASSAVSALHREFIETEHGA